VQKNAALPREAKKRPTEYAAMAIDLAKAGPRTWNEAGKNGGYDHQCHENGRIALVAARADGEDEATEN